MWLVLQVSAPMSVSQANDKADEFVRKFYGAWGQSGEGDADIGRQLLSSELMTKVTSQRRRCEQTRSAADCVDLVTCLPDLADVERVRLDPRSNQQHFLATVDLRGRNTSKRSSALWDMQLVRNEMRLHTVTCTSSTTSDAAPRFTPTTSSAARAMKVFKAAQSAGSDIKQTSTALANLFSVGAQQTFMHDLQQCGATPGASACIGNGLACGGENGATIVEGTQEQGVEMLVLAWPNGKHSIAAYSFDRANKVTRLECQDVADETKAQVEAPSPVPSNAPSAIIRGRCTGVATCGFNCSAPGCYKGNHTCLGSPPACDGRSRIMCNMPCYWMEPPG
jgi:hypothetical protein